MKRAILFAALVMMLVFVSVQSYAFEDSSYTTPDAWKQHFSIGSVKYNTGSMSAGSGTLDATVTSRTGIRSFNSDSLVQEFVYLRLKGDDFQVANGTLRLNFFGRFGFATEEFESEDFNVTKNAFYAEREDDAFAVRFYNANVELDQVIPYTNLKLGRTYLSHIDTRLIDGGDITVTPTEMVGIFAFGGIPVSHYTSNTRTMLFGGGVDVRPTDILRIRAGYDMYSYDGDEDDYRYDKDSTGVVRARVDANVMDVAKVYADYSMIDPASVIEIGGMADFATQTSLFASFSYITDFFDNKTSTLVDAYSTSLGQEGKNMMLNGRISQGLLNWLVLSVGGQAKIISGDTDFAHRDFYNGYGNLDINGLIPDLYISINGGIWFAPEDGAFKEESTFQGGGQVSYRLMEALDIWAGTSFEMFTYKYYIEGVGANSNVSSYASQTNWEPIKTFEQNSRSFYIGGQYTLEELGALSKCAIGLDISANSSDVYSALNDEPKDELDLQVALNINAVL